RETAAGVVIYAGDEISTYGNLILVRHENDWVSAYAHNKDFKVKKGDRVSRGQIIARSGKTGDADRPKLHFELRKNSNPVDPKRHLSGA
ncbi:MAG: M23 family metallopeptidase, partial [Pseudomonadota bacterium]